MTNKSRSSLKILAIILFVLWALMVKSIIVIPVLAPYLFWIAVISFILLLVASR